MPLVSKPLPALFNGVSQQPATLRLDSQGEAQINGYGTVVDGLLKRMPFQHVAKVTNDSLATTAHIHTINRDTTERYIVVITDGDLKVYDIDGVEQTVNFPQGKAYLDATDPLNNFAVVSIADYSFIVNKSVTVATQAAPTVVPPELADWYAPRFWNQDPLRFYNPAQGTDKGTLQTFGELPTPDDPAPPTTGDVYRIAGQDQNNFGEFWVRRMNGFWEETFEPGTSLGLDPLTMPHALVRESNGDFTFTQFLWNVRKVGGDNGNPPPSFVGTTINDVFYHKNRLGFVADENVIFSGAGDFGNFFRATMTDILDADVVDVAVSSTQVSLLRYAIPFNNQLMLFADQTQFALNVDELLTPSTVSIDAVTDYEMSSDVRPVNIGNDVYFITPSGEYSRIREYYVQEEGNSTSANDITAHVPRYLPKDIFQLSGNSNEDVLFALSSAEGERNRIYVYKFFWNEEGKAQSSWSYWELFENDRIISISDLENVLYVLVERDDGVYLEKCIIQSGAVAPGMTFDVLLDRRTPITGVYSGGSDTTTFTLPYPIPLFDARDEYKLVRGGDFSGQVGSLIAPQDYTWLNNTQIQVPGDETDGEVYGGVNYTFRYQFSEQFMKAGDRAITTGRLMLRTFTIYFTDTAFFSTEIDPYGNGTPLVEGIVPSQLSAFTGKTLGEASLVTGEPAFHTGDYSFQIYGDSTQALISLLNNTHVQCRIQSAEWEALYFNRARAI